MRNLFSSLPLQRSTDRAVLRLTRSVMKASFEAPDPSARRFARALGAGSPQVTRFGTALLRPLEARLRTRLRDCFEGEVAEEFLEILLRAMQIVVLLDPRFHRQVADFNGRYQFLSADGSVTIGAVFEGGRLHVSERIIADPNVTLTFQNGKALLRFLLNPQPDILVAVLHHQVKPEGNLNYLYKFGYLAKQLSRLVPAA